MRIGEPPIFWQPGAQKALCSLIFNIDFCIEYFLPICFSQKSASSKTQIVHSATSLTKIWLTYFGNVKKIKLFWQNLTDHLQKHQLIPRNYPKNMAVFLGLKSDTSKFSLQLNFCFLLARHYIWCCRSSKNIPQLKGFLVIIKSQLNIETYKTGSNLKKWDPLIPIFNSTDLGD